MFPAGPGLRDCGDAAGGDLPGGDEEEHIWEDSRFVIADCWGSFMDILGLVFH